MPNRMLREGILTSPRIARLGWPEEVFYRRLMSIVDDFGRYYADPGMLRAACYPRQLSKVADSDIGKWTRSLAEAGLVRVYRASDRESYLELLDFRQQVRAKASKFPPPPSGCVADATQLIANAHLDVDVDVGVGVGVGEGARPRGRSGIDAPTDEHRALAQSLEVACEAEWSKYLDWQKAKGKMHRDLEAGFRNWLKKAATDFRPKQGGSRSTPTLAEKRAANIAALTGQVKHEREVFAERVGGAVIPALPSSVREQSRDDVGRFPGSGGQERVG